MFKWLKTWFNPFDGVEGVEKVVPDVQKKFFDDVVRAQAAQLKASGKFLVVHRGEQESGWKALDVDPPDDWSTWIEVYPRPVGNKGFVLRQEKLGKYGRKWVRCWSVGQVPLTASAEWDRL